MESLSLGQLQSLIKKGIDDAHPLHYWVTAEISELKVNYSGHCYLELVEKGGDNHIPKAKANAVIWRSAFGMLSSYFVSSTGRELAAGMKVLVKVAVSYSELYGLSLQITDIDPSYTLGDMERQRMETIERLKKDGVYDMNREIPLPPVIQRIAVVSSRNAAGYQDFMDELSQGGYYFETVLFDAFMQGDAAESSIVAALCAIAQEADDYDAVVIIRGGGSRSDMGTFDSYLLASYIAQFPLPVITGIGHDKDRSVADLVAAVPLKTPTAVAVYLNEALGGFETVLDEMYAELANGAVSLLDGNGRRLQAAMDTITTVSHTLSMENNRLRHIYEMLSQASRTFIDSRTKELSLLGRLAQSRDPQHIIELGFAVVKHAGAVIADGRNLSQGDGIEIVMRDAVVGAGVKNIKTKNG